MDRIRRPCMMSALLVALAVTSADAGGSEATVSESQFVFEGQPVWFVSAVTNPYFPLVPGTQFFFDGWKEGVSVSSEMFVTYHTKEILGVKCTVVRDSAYENGILAEYTFDWYAQDAAGNVWYFGEDTQEIDAEGNIVSTEGSWEAGKHGAQPGIIMKAHPSVGDRYLQELAPGVAEDAAEVLSVSLSRCVPYGCFDDLRVIQEWTRLSPGVFDKKYYARGVGFVLGQNIKGGDEWLALRRTATRPPPE